MSGAGGERGLASVGELRIAYESAETGAPAVMLIHGALGDRTYFAPEVTHLASRTRVMLSVPDQLNAMLDRFLDSVDT